MSILTDFYLFPEATLRDKKKALVKAVEKMQLENDRLRARLAELEGQEPVGWFTEEHITDKSATTYSKEVAERWRSKGWPVNSLYTAPVPAIPLLDHFASTASDDDIKFWQDEMDCTRNQAKYYYARSMIEERQCWPSVPAIPNVDDLAQFIRIINGNNDMGAGVLAEHICEWIATARGKEK